MIMQKQNAKISLKTPVLAHYTYMLDKKQIETSTRALQKHLKSILKMTPVCEWSHVWESTTL